MCLPPKTSTDDTHVWNKPVGVLWSAVENFLESSHTQSFDLMYLIKQLHWAQSSWESTVPQTSMKFSAFYETHRPLPSSHVSLISQIYPVHILTSYFSNIHFNIVLPSTPRFSKWSLSFGFLHQNTVRISSPLQLPHSRPSHPPWFYYPKNLL